MDFSPVLTRLEAYFPSFDQAKQAAVELMSFDKAGYYDVNEYSIAGSYLIEDITGDTIEQGDRVLISVEPPVSIGDINYDNVRGQSPFRLTFTVPEEGVDQSLDIVKKYGGSSNNSELNLIP